MARADIMAGRAFVSLYMKDQLTKPLRTAQKELNSFGSSLLGIGSKIAAMGGTVAGGLAAAVAHFASVGSNLNDMSARTGISTTALVELGYAAEQTGTDVETLEGGIQKMQKNLGGLGPESKKALMALSAMGVVCDDISGLAPEDQFEAIAESIGRIEDPSQRAAAAMAIFGKSGTALLPMMQNIRELRKEARELGIAPSPESIKAADALGDAIDKVRKVVGAAVFEIGAALAPLGTRILEVFLGAAIGVKKFVTENKDLIVTIAKVAIGVFIVGSAIAAIGAAFIGAGAAISGIVAVFSALSAIAGVIASVLGAILSPLGLLIAGLAALVTYSGAAGAALDWLKGQFGNLASDATDAFGAIAQALAAGDISLAAEVLWALLKLEWQRGVTALTEIWQSAKVSILNTWDDIGNKLAESWINTIAFLSNAWTAFITEAENFGRGFLAGAAGALGIDSGVGPADPKKSEAELKAREQKRLDDLQSLREIRQHDLDPKARERESEAQKEVDKARDQLKNAQDAFRGKVSEAEKRPGRMPKPGEPEGPAFFDGNTEKASKATFSAAGLTMNSAAGGGQLQATLGVKKAVENQTKKFEEFTAAQLEFSRSMNLHHP